jgi:ectoine hydroxylase-related dioxygenase (phytanoyl-CoA dioxygenase family)
VEDPRRVLTFAETVDHFGSAVMHRVLPSPILDHLLEDLGRTPLARTRAGIRRALQHPGVMTVATVARLLEPVRSVLGCDAFPFCATLFVKSPDSNWLVAWHQDKALPLRQRDERPGWGRWSVKDGILYANAPAQALSQVLALRLHLDDSTAENGPLRVLPGTHTQGVLTDDVIHELADRISPLEYTTSRGGVLAMRPLLIHASSKSRTQKPRRVLHIEYAASSKLEGLNLAVA